MKTAILWFRRDLRLSDNPALNAALASAERVLPVYIHAPDEAAPWGPGAASRWWLHHSLAALDRQLRARGAPLILRAGPSAATLLALATETGARAVFWNRVYEPALLKREADLHRCLAAAGLQTESFNATLLFEPGSIRTGARSAYRVFTPFWRACQRHGLDLQPLPSSRRRFGNGPAPSSLHLPQLELLPRIPWDAGLRHNWTPGEAAARARLKAFCRDGLGRYATDRDRPDRPGTSGLSPHLHFGEISPRQVLTEVSAHSVRDSLSGADQGAEALVRELGWREFAHHVLAHYPRTAGQSMDRRFAHFPWRRRAHALLQAWQQGRVGVPIIDAGMRQLWETGWMHNRVRMLCASFLTKNCRIPWQRGARWFWDTLVDADLANNTLGWQWVAGTGADAAPFIRIFNPVTQGERFDPGGDYVRRWIPELERLPERWVHQPWNAPLDVQRQCGLRIGRDYPAPMVDLQISRREALARYRGRLAGR